MGTKPHALFLYNSVRNGCLFPDSEGQHREVVTLLSITNELVDGGGHCLNQFLGRSFKGCEDLVDALLAEKFMDAILGLRQPVGIEEQGHVGS